MGERMTKGRNARAQKTESLAEEVSTGGTVVPGIAATAQALELTGGRYLVQHLGIDGTSTTVAGRVYPFAVLFAPDRKANSNLVRFVGTDGGGLARLLTPGDRTIVEVSPGGRTIFFSVFNVSGRQSGIRLGIKRLPAGDTTSVNTPVIQIAVHLQDIGDQKSTGGGWIGLRDSQLRLEAFAIAIPSVKSGGIEYFAAGGAQPVNWVGAGRLAGSKGRALPLNRFAIRVNGDLAREFSVIYQGHFAQSGESKVCRNGEICSGSSVDDYLVAIRVSLVAPEAPRAFPFSPALEHVRSSDVVEVSDLVAGAAQAAALARQARDTSGEQAVAGGGPAARAASKVRTAKGPQKKQSQSASKPQRRKVR